MQESSPFLVSMSHLSHSEFHDVLVHDDEEEEEEDEDEIDTELDEEDLDDEEKGQRVPLLFPDASSSSFHQGSSYDENNSQNRTQVFPSTPQLLAKIHKIGENHRILPDNHSFPPSPTTANAPTSNGHAHIFADVPISPPSPSSNSNSQPTTNFEFLERRQIISSQVSKNKTRRSSRGYPLEIKKTLIALVFMCVNMFLTGISLAVVHEYSPLTPPLPDQILDRLSYQNWALFGSEYLLQAQSAIAIVIIVFHKHRTIVLRRAFVIIGVLYLYRSITMFVTALPKSDPEYHCAPKSNTTLSVGEVFSRAFSILTGFGLSVNGKHIFCGDFIYSGHTTILLLGYLLIKEYTPRQLYILHWLCWVNASTAVVLLLLSRGHYTVDVIIAYFITTRSWATYHTLASFESLKQRSSSNHFSNFWWFDGFRWIESDVKAGRLPNEYNLPIPKRLLKICRLKVRTSLHSSRRGRRVASAIS